MAMQLLNENSIQLLNKGLDLMSRNVIEVQFWSSLFFTILVVAGPNGICVVLRLRLFVESEVWYFNTKVLHIFKFIF